MQAFSEQDLIAAGGLMSTSARNSGTTQLFVDVNDPVWINTKEYTEYLRAQARLHSEARMDPGTQAFLLCRSSSKIAGSSVFYSIWDFETRSMGGRIEFNHSVRSQERQANAAQTQAMRAQNMRWVRMYMMGDCDTPLLCGHCKDVIDSNIKWGRPGYDLVGHHMRYYNNVSVNKRGEDPGQYLANLDLSNPSTIKCVEAVQDLSGLVFLCSGCHDGLHKRYRNHHDITQYEHNWLPWTWQSEHNWHTWCSFVTHHGYPHPGSYSDNLVKQTN